MERIVIKVKGMYSAHCERSIRQALYSLLGVSKVVVDLFDNRVIVDYGAHVVEPLFMLQEIERLGYEAGLG